MEGLTLLAAAHATGLQVRVEGEHLIVRGPKRLALLAQQLLRHKDEVLAIVETFEERAAMAEYDGGLSREAAERVAWQCVLGETPRTAAANGSAGLERRQQRCIETQSSQTMYANSSTSGRSAPFPGTWGCICWILLLTTGVASSRGSAATVIRIFG